MRGWVAAGLLVVVALTGAAFGDGERDDPARSGTGSLPALHADPDPEAGGRISDTEGRDVLLRGVNVNALAEYWQGTEFPTTFPLRRRDPERMASIGWNTVRLLVSWSRIEAEPGRYDGAYLDEVEEVIDELAAVGIYTIIDFHQDAWGPTLAAHPDEVCPPGLTPALGWDGAPGWATLAGDASRCTPGVRELSPAVMAAWDAFFADEPAADGVGVQTRYVEMVGHVARRFAANTAVAGYDLMNEPNAFEVGEIAALSAMYERAVAAIRAGEQAVRDGFPHLVLFEPPALWSTTGRGAPPVFAHDDNVVYAPSTPAASPTARSPPPRSPTRARRPRCSEVRRWCRGSGGPIPIAPGPTATATSSSISGFRTSSPSGPRCGRGARAAVTPTRAPTFERGEFPRCGASSRSTAATTT